MLWESIVRVSVVPSVAHGLIEYSCSATDDKSGSSSNKQIRFYRKKNYSSTSILDAEDLLTQKFLCGQMSGLSLSVTWHVNGRLGKETNMLRFRRQGIHPHEQFLFFTISWSFHFATIKGSNTQQAIYSNSITWFILFIYSFIFFL